MSYDKIVDSTQLDADLSSIANAIRSKGGTSAGLTFPSGFVSAINGIATDSGTGSATTFVGTHFATDTVKNVTAGQAITVTDIKDEKTGEPFDVKGIMCFIQPSATKNVAPVNYAANTPATFCFVRDYSRNFGLAMAGHSDDTDPHVREVRLNLEVGSSTDSKQTITISGNSFTYKARDDMWGVIKSTFWRWIAWG